MIFRLLFALALCLILITPITARADLLDFINGRMVGKELQPSNLLFYGKQIEINNRVILVDFWASWCEACRDSIPELNKLNEEYSAKNFIIIGLTQDKTEEISLFLKKFPINYSIATDVGGALFKRLSVRAMPYAVLVNKKGIIIWQGDPQTLKRSQIELALTEPSILVTQKK